MRTFYWTPCTHYAADEAPVSLSGHSFPCGGCCGEAFGLFPFPSLLSEVPLSSPVVSLPYLEQIKRGAMLSWDLSQFQLLVLGEHDWDGGKGRTEAGGKQRQVPLGV